MRYQRLLNVAHGSRVIVDLSTFGHGGKAFLLTLLRAGHGKVSKKADKSRETLLRKELTTVDLAAFCR
jgi:hypothetical protein